MVQEPFDHSPSGDNSGTASGGTTEQIANKVNADTKVMIVCTLKGMAFEMLRARAIGFCFGLAFGVISTLLTLYIRGMH